MGMIETAPFEFAVENYPLAPTTLYKVGGPARVALLPRNAEDAVEAVAWMAEQDVPKVVLGGGSNVLVADAGFPGIVLMTTHMLGLEDLGEHRYRIEGGVELGDMVTDIMLAHNFAGVGGLTGIPGSVGGAIYMNAGTNKGTTCELMESVDIVTKDGLQTIPMEPQLYGYRGQSFCPRDGLILRGVFTFEITDEPQRPIYDRYIARRKETQPKGNCCGSVFKNPEGEHAGRLIEACGLKGTRHGGAAISDLHANFIMNEDNATCDDILALIALAKRTVKEQHGVDLHEEVVFMG
jgi:UDP-N-acetylmuramate dehydrogenase